MCSPRTASLQADPSFDDIYGPGLVYDGRASTRLRDWIPSLPSLREALTGGPLAVLGDMPVLCNRAAADERWLQLMGEIGLSVPSRIHAYRGEQEYLSELQRLARPGVKLVMQHLHPPDELPAESYWIPPSLLSYLNNKKNLALLVPVGHAPERETVSRSMLAARLREHDTFPIVLKAATDQTSGGGRDVMICRNSEDTSRAVSFFEACREVVVEQFLVMETNLCLNMAVATDGRIHHLGCAEQVSNDDGAYRGNWLVREATRQTVLSLGQQIAEKAAAMGYVGVFGVDMCRLPGGRVVAFDLNFRINGSTVGLMLWKGCQGPGARVARSRTWTCKAGFTSLLSTVRMLAARGDLLPLSTYNPDACEYGGDARVSGLLTGGTRAEVEEKERELASMGLE